MSDKPRVVMVDDEPNILSAYRRSIGRKYDLQTYEGGPKAIEAFRAGVDAAVVVTDMRMPEMSGVEFVQAARKIRPDSVYVMLTGNADQQTAIDAINQGRVFRFLNKPCPPEELDQTIRSALRQYELIHAEKTLLRETLMGSVKLFAEIMTLSDPDLAEASKQIRADVRRLGEAVGVSSHWQLPLAASLALLGAVAQPPASIATRLEDKNLDLTADIGSRLLKHIPRLQSVAAIIAAQRERGYLPEKIADLEEPDMVLVGARLLRFAVDWRRETINWGNDRAKGLERLESDASDYDKRLLEAAKEIVESGVCRADIPTEAISVPIKRLHAGDIMCEPLTTRNGLTLVQSGEELTPLIIERIRAFEKAELMAEGSVNVIRPTAEDGEKAEGDANAEGKPEAEPETRAA